MINKSLFSSNSEMWETPQNLFNILNDEFHFDVDVCATTDNAKCKMYFTPQKNGLKQDWTGLTCWCNPPYGKNISLWIEKAAKSNTTVVMLLPVRTDTKYFHEFIYHKAEIRFLKGRLHFNNSKNAAPFPSMIVIFRGGKTK